MTAVFLPLALIAALGAFLRHVMAGMEERWQAMNLLVLYVFLPALVFQTVMDARLDRLFIESRSWRRAASRRPSRRRFSSFISCRSPVRPRA